MRLTLQPNGRLSVGHDAGSYVIALPANETAILDRVDGRGWQLTIRRRGVDIDRGFFGSTQDIVALLEAEYLPRPE